MISCGARLAPFDIPQLREVMAYDELELDRIGDLRLAAGMTTNMIANMSKEGKHISMDTLARICETLNCEITDVIELVPDEPASTGGKEHERIETKNNGKRN